MTRILFTGAGRRIELIQAFRNAALVLNQDLKIYGADMTGTAPALAYCDYVRQIVPMKDPGYIDALLNICREDRIDLVIPTIDTDLMTLAENRNMFLESGTKVMISDPEMIRICRDKNLTSAFFESCGVCAPHPVNDWLKYDGGFPAFIKPKDGSSSINAFKVDNREELEVYASQIDDYIVQPFIDGMEFTIDVFCDWEGTPISIVPRERVQVRAGEVLKTRIYMDPMIIEEAKRICSRFRPCGPMTVQLIRDSSSGIDYFIEINPRFGGGAPLSMKAGARSAESILRLLNGNTITPFDSIADGAVYSRFDQSVCVEEGRHNIRGVIFDLDDTLYSEIEYIKSGFHSVSEYLGGGYEEKMLQYFKAGHPAIDRLLDDLGRTKEKSHVLDIYRSHLPDIHLYNGIKDLIMGLKQKGYYVGIITDGRPVGQRNKIAALGLDKLLNDDDIIITDELGGTQFRKPCDIAFRILQTRWRLSAGDIVYVGDNAEKDMQAPRQLGMNCVLFRNPEGIYCNAINNCLDNTVDSLEELTAVLF